MTGERTDAGGPSRPDVFLEFVGLLAAGLFLVGRWAPVPGGDRDALLQARFWALALLLFFIGLDRLLGPGRLSRETRDRDGARTTSLALVFLSYTLASVIWAPDLSASLGKALEVAILILAVPAFRYCSRAFGRARFNEVFWRDILFLGTVLVAFVLATGLARNKRTINALGGGPNTFGRIMGFLFIAALAHIFVKNRKWAYAAVAAAAVLIVMSGSRGALLSTAVGGLAFLALSRFSLRKRALVLLLSGGLVAFIVFRTPFGRVAAETFQKRVVQLTLVEGHDAGRRTIYERAYELGRESPAFGHGLDSFKAYSAKKYPHNIFLEVFFEGGLVGLALFLLFLFSVLQSVFRNRRNLNIASAAALALIFTASQFSGDLYDSRAVFLLPVLLLNRAGRAGRPENKPAGEAVPSAPDARGGLVT